MKIKNLFLLQLLGIAYIQAASSSSWEISQKSSDISEYLRDEEVEGSMLEEVTKFLAECRNHFELESSLSNNLKEAEYSDQKIEEALEKFQNRSNPGFKQGGENKYTKLALLMNSLDKIEPFLPRYIHRELSDILNALDLDELISLYHADNHKSFALIDQFFSHHLQTEFSLKHLLTSIASDYSKNITEIIRQGYTANSLNHKVTESIIEQNQDLLEKLDDLIKAGLNRPLNKLSILIQNPKRQEIAKEIYQLIYSENLDEVNRQTEQYDQKYAIPVSKAIYLGINQRNNNGGFKRRLKNQRKLVSKIFDTIQLDESQLLTSQKDITREFTKLTQEAEKYDIQDYIILVNSIDKFLVKIHSNTSDDKITQYCDELDQLINCFHNYSSQYLVNEMSCKENKISRIIENLKLLKEHVTGNGENMNQKSLNWLSGTILSLCRSIKNI